MLIKKHQHTVHCAMVRKDKENFPFKIAELSNWDEELLPQYCGHFTYRPKFLVFSNRHGEWNFIGSYSTPELAEKAELQLPQPRVVANFNEFQYEVPKKALPRIAAQLVVKLPVADSELTPQMVWDLLQLYQSDNDVHDKMNAHDWLRALFFKVGIRTTYDIMSRYGMYGIKTMRGVIKDLRYEAYAKGKVIDIRPLHKWRVDYAAKVIPRLDGNKDNEKKLYGNKLYIRVK
jgi:hypothetical protein